MKKFSFSGSSVAEVAEGAEVSSISRKQPAEVMPKSAEITPEKEIMHLTSEGFRIISANANHEIILGSATSATSNGLEVKNGFFASRKVSTEVAKVKEGELVVELIPNLNPCLICKGIDFVHGDKGGYYCKACQPNARAGTSVIATGCYSRTDKK